MSHQDDLESNYKAASNEQPSNEIDQLIIQAANDALEISTVQNNDRSVPDSSNIVKGRFRLRQWQTPVSVAAAALFTISFISTYDLWQVNEQDSAQDTLNANLPYNDETYIQEPDKIVSKKELTSPPPSLPQETDDTIERNQISQVTQQSRRKTLAVKKQPNQAQLTNIVNAELPKAMTKLDSINTLDDSLSEIESLPVADVSKEEVNIQNRLLMLDVTMWLEKIENAVKNDKIENAKAEIDILIKQHPLSSFTKQQRDRLDTINNKIQLALVNENK